MKKLFVVFLLLFAFSVYGNQPTVTFVKVEESGVKAYTFSFATDAIGVGVVDTAVIAPSTGFFTVDEWNQFDPTVRFSSSEATADSVRFDIIWQGKTHVSGSWVTLETVTADNALFHLDVFTQNTYGRWPFLRILIITGDAKTAIQTLTGQVLVKKDFR